MAGAPIVLFHYGYSEYLKYTIQAAVRSNPDTRIILVGDVPNEHLTDLGIEHRFFDVFLNHSFLKRLDEVYVRCGGEVFEQINTNKGGKDWTLFNFQKWFVLYLICQEEKLDRVWTFDSDTLIVENLAELEDGFSEYDYTAINANNVMQGVINTGSALKDYCELCVEMLSDKALMKKLLEVEFKENPAWGFTMMRVFKALSAEGKYSFKQLRIGLNNLYFDECICQSHDEQITDFALNNYRLKRMFVDTNGHLYVRDKSTKVYRRLFATNLSWVPTYVFRRIFDSTTPASHEGGSAKMSEISLVPTPWYKISVFWKRVRNKLKRIFNIN